MKFRHISKLGDGIGLAFRIKQEGHTVDFYLKDEEGPHLYEGVLPRVPDWHKGLTKDMILVYDMVGLGKEADALRKQGYKIFGASEIADDLELKRGLGLDVSADNGIEIPESYDFQDYEKAKEHLEKDEGDDTGWVFKPEHNKDGVQTFVSTSTAQMLAMLDYFATKWTDGVDFILQKVQEGTEVSSEAWFINGELIPNSYNNTWETKKDRNDNIGAMTGCQSSTVKFNACPELYDQLFGKLAKWIKQKKYTGPLDLNCIIDYDGTPYLLEFTARMGYSAIYAFCEILNMPISEFIATIAEGKIPKIKPLGDWAGSLRLTMPPYPHCDEAPEAEGVPILGIDDFKHIWPLDVMMKDGKMFCSGFDSIVAEVTGHAPDLQNMWEEIYSLVGTLEIPKMQMRTDCYSNAVERISALSELGLTEEMEI